MIRHTVMFRLRHPRRSAEETEFLSAATVLARIPGVRQFEKLAQVSPKNEFTFGFSMEFEDPAAYDFYNSHPDHVAFVRIAGFRKWNAFWKPTTRSSPKAESDAARRLQQPCCWVSR